MIATTVRLLSLMPLSINRHIGAALGHLAWALNGSLRRITLINLALCYPKLTEKERTAIAKASLLHTGRSLTESSWIWLRNPNKLMMRARIAQGEALFEEALASEHGLLIATPHIGNWEALNTVIARNHSMTYMYRPPRAIWLEPLFLRWRANFNAEPARLDASGLRQVLKKLRNGQIVGVLPDQEPDLQNGVFAPLFGIPTNSMTLVQKLATRGQAKVLFCVCERESGSLFPMRKSGWVVSFLEPETAIFDADPVIAATAMNKAVEQCIALNPEQYLWSYKRFNLLPEGGRRNYKSPRA